MCGDSGSVCGIFDSASVPLALPVRTAVTTLSRSYYFYRWEAGNNRPSVYGSVLGPGETLSASEKSYIGVPALRSQRFSAGNGPQDSTAHHEAALNFPINCGSTAFDVFYPDVISQTPPFPPP